MIISKQDFNQIKSELITLFHESRKCGDIYVMEECGYLVEKLTEIELENLKKRKAFKS